MCKKKLKNEQILKTEIKKQIENNCSCVETKKEDLMINKVDYNISLFRNYNYTTREKKQILKTSACKKFIYTVLRTEAPIHIEECFLRITKYLNIKSAKQYYSSYMLFLKQEINSENIIEKNGFLYLNDTKILIRNRNTINYHVYCGKLNISYIPPEEIIQIAKFLIKYHYGINKEELATLISKEIGFERMTKNIKEVIFKTLEYLNTDEEIKYNFDRYYCISKNQNDFIKQSKITEENIIPKNKKLNFIIKFFKI